MSLDWLVIILIPIIEMLSENEANREHKERLREREREGWGGGVEKR